MPTILGSRQIEIAPPLADPFEQPLERLFPWSTIIQEAEQVHGNLRANPRPIAGYAFRSLILPNADTRDIAEADDAAYAAITGSEELSNQLITYYRGERDEKGRALSMCLWKTAEAAFQAVHGVNAHKHRHAANQTKEYYGENWSLETYSLLPADNGVLFIPHDNPHSPARRRHLLDTSLLPPEAV
jgi:hypothetical protein